MQPPKDIDVLFVAGFGPIVRESAASRRFYYDTLGLAFKEDANGYMYTAGLEGVKHLRSGRCRRRRSRASAQIAGPPMCPCRRRGSNSTWRISKKPRPSSPAAATNCSSPIPRNPGAKPSPACSARRACSSA